MINLGFFSDYINIQQLNLEQNGEDTIIYFGKDKDSTQKLILRNINKSDLTNDHFKFKQFSDVGDFARYQGDVNYDFNKDNKIEGNQDIGTVTYLNSDNPDSQNGDDGDNILIGGTGDDVLNGGAGNDILYGNDDGTFGGEFMQTLSSGFAESQGWSSNNLYPRELADVNGDGYADIVVKTTT